MENSVYSMWGTSFFHKIVLRRQRLMQAAPPSKAMNSSVYKVLICGAPPSFLTLDTGYHVPEGKTFNILPGFPGEGPGLSRAGPPAL